MFYDTLSTVGLDSSVSVDGDARDILDIEMLEPPTIFADILHPSVRDQGTALNTQLLEVGTVLGEQPQSQVRHVALANIQRPQS